VKLAPSDVKKVASSKPPRADSALVGKVKSVIAAQDQRGRWVEDGRLRYHGSSDPATKVIRCATFIRNVETLSRYLAAQR
jgi:hypothetical protein